MKLNITSVRFKNFFSYGAKEQSFELNDGISFIVGQDLDRGSSNGSGKSITTDAIVFGLFGKTVKDVTQQKIVNWKNKKNCEVSIEFSIGETSYRIERGLKPNFLRLYKEGKEVDQVSHKTEFQTEIEDNILGIDYDTFISLIHCNPNTNVSIFTASKAQKRQLIETLFNLDSYSKINQKANEQLNKTTNQISDLQNTVSLNDRYISDTQIQYEKLENSNDTPVDNTNKINNLKEQIKNFNPNTNTVIEELKTQLNQINKDKLLQLQEELEKINSELSTLDDIAVNEKLITKINSIISSLNRQLRNFEAPEKLLGLKVLNDNLVKVRKQIERKKETIENNKVQLNEFNNNIKIIKSEEKSLPSLDHLEDGCECPTCLSVVNVSLIENTINERRASIKSRIDEIEAKKNEIDLDKDKTELAQFESLETKLVSRIEIERLMKKYNVVNKLQPILKSEESKKLEFSRKTSLIGTQTITKERIVSEENNLVNQKNNLENKILTEKNNLSNQLSMLEERLKSEEKSQAFYLEQQRTLAEFKKTTLDKIEDYKNENKEIEKKICVLKHDKDYYEYIKTMCKDENVKQYAISSIIPYINQRANHYLTEAGFNFYLKIDSFLDVEIKGPGITGATFGNLSGGESKSVSLALQFALLDVCKIKSNIFPNVLILDEILDSAIDAQVIEKMMNIVKAKQLTDELKVIIVSHRKEINSVEADYVYSVTKQKGFSTLSEVK